MTENRKKQEGAPGAIRTMRLPAGGVRIELRTALGVAFAELNVQQAEKHRQDMNECLKPLGDTGAAALAVERSNG